MTELGEEPRLIPHEAIAALMDELQVLAARAFGKGASVVFKEETLDEADIEHQAFDLPALPRLPGMSSRMRTLALLLPNGEMKSVTYSDTRTFPGVVTGDRGAIDQMLEFLRAEINSAIKMKGAPPPCVLYSNLRQIMEKDERLNGDSLVRVEIDGVRYAVRNLSVEDLDPREEACLVLTVNQTEKIHDVLTIDERASHAR